MNSGVPQATSQTKFAVHVSQNTSKQSCIHFKVTPSYDVIMTMKFHNSFTSPSDLEFTRGWKN